MGLNIISNIFSREYDNHNTNKFMSQNLETEKQEYFEELKSKAYEEAGLIRWGVNSDGDTEWVGTDEKFKKGQELLEEYLNEEY